MSTLNFSNYQQSISMTYRHEFLWDSLIQIRIFPFFSKCYHKNRITLIDCNLQSRCVMAKDFNHQLFCVFLVSYNDISKISLGGTCFKLLGFLIARRLAILSSMLLPIPFGTLPQIFIFPPKNLNCTQLHYLANQGEKLPNKRFHITRCISR